MKMTVKGYDILRVKFGKLSTAFVQTTEFIIGRAEAAGFSYSETAYLLATTYHETAGTMKPITEYGGVRYFDKYDTGKLAKQLGNTPEADGDGYKYRGRGYVQITGLGNYSKFAKLLNVDLVNKPDLALDPEIAIQIAIKGMKGGLFTGKGYNTIKLGRYDRTNLIKARGIINGTDRAEKIADEALVWEQALRSP